MLGFPPAPPVVSVPFGPLVGAVFPCFASCFLWPFVVQLGQLEDKKMEIVVGGSRALSPLGVVSVRVLARRLLLAGASVRVGCAAGADLLFLDAFASAGAAARLSVFAAGSSAGAGFLSPVSFPVLSAAAAAGASVSWLAGGPLSVPLRGRLAARSLAAVSGAFGGVWVVSRPASRGSLVAGAALARAGGVVLFLPVGFAPAALAPLPGLAGAWVPAPLPSLPRLVRWSPAVAQPSLFD